MKKVIVLFLTTILIVCSLTACTKTNHVADDVFNTLSTTITTSSDDFTELESNTNSDMPENHVKNFSNENQKKDNENESIANSSKNDEATRNGTESKPDSVPTILPEANIITEPEYTQEEKEMFDLVNSERHKNGLTELEWSNELYEISKIRAEEASICWSHTRPDGTKIADMFPGIKALSKSTLCGENLASGFDNCSKAMEGLMNSEGHRANILNKKYTRIAISLYADPNNECVYIAQIFSN